MIEITGRAGGTCLPEMVSIYYGINYYEAIVRLALGMDVQEMSVTKFPVRQIFPEPYFRIKMEL